MQVNAKPAFIKGEICEIRYDGVSNDLLTGGRGKSGLAAPSLTRTKGPVPAHTVLQTTP
jgi:hypothetical protein